jgi:DNA-binding protein Fis
MSFQGNQIVAAELRDPHSSLDIAERVLQQRLDEIITILSLENRGKKKIYDDIVSLVEKILIQSALNRSNQVKSAAASFLGINRNTLHNKMEKFGITADRSLD